MAECLSSDFIGLKTDWNVTSAVKEASSFPEELVYPAP